MSFVPKHGTRVEHAIVRALIRQLKAAGWEARYVYNGEDRTYLRTENQALEAVFAVNDVNLYFIKDKARHWVRLIAGNGEDIISDWSYSAQCKDDFDDRLEAVLELVAKGIYELREAK